MKNIALQWGHASGDGKGLLFRPHLAVLLVLCFVLAVPLACDFIPGVGSEKLDRDALVAFYNATGGEDWERSWPIDKKVHYADWFGISADEEWVGTGPGSSGAGMELTNYSLRLGGNNLRGELPPELGDVGDLKGLDLSGNQLSGQIPPELGKLGDLRTLHLPENQLSGQIPPELGKLDGLCRLYLDKNQLSGEIPSKLEDMDNLEFLNLSENQLNGLIPPEPGRHRQPGISEAQWEPIEWIDSARAGQTGPPERVVST